MAFRSLARTLLLALPLVLLGACSSSSAEKTADATDPCTRLDLSMPTQATVKAYADAASALRTDLGAIEDRVFHVCDAMNAALALARPRNTYDACATFRARVETARTAGAQIALQLDASCTVDSSAGDQCASMCPAETCTATDCSEIAPCHDACNAVAVAGVACTVDTTPVLSAADDDLTNAITANASEWGTLESLIAQIQATAQEIGPPLLDYAKTADVIGKDEQDCYENALGNLGVALISLDAATDGLASLPPVAAH